MTLMMHIFDMNNFARRHVEAAGTSGIHACFTHIAFHPGIVIAVWDGPGGKKRRADLYPDYKKRRQLPDENISKGMNIVSDVLKHSKALQVRVPGYEADDVIAALCRMYGHIPIHIHSLDADFSQLLHHPTITLERHEFRVPPEEVRLYKCTVGDASDNITGVKGFGQGAWKKLVKADKDRLTLLGQGGAVDIDSIYLPEASKKWLKTEQGLALFRTFWTIVGFFDVPADLITEHSEQGVENVEEANKIMRKYLLEPVDMNLSMFGAIPRGLYDNHSNLSGSN